MVELDIIDVDKLFNQAGGVKVLVIIPAKGDSKRLPRKNLQEINGKSLVEHAIDYAKECNYVTDIVVSTEDREVLDIAVQQDVIAMRREESLCGDTDVVDVFVDVLKNLQGEPDDLDDDGGYPMNDGEAYDYVVGLQPDHPDKSCSLTHCLRYMVENSYDDLITVTPDSKRNGSIRIFKYEHLLGGLVSRRVGCVQDTATDIHYEKDLDLVRSKLNN